MMPKHDLFIFILVIAFISLSWRNPSASNYKTETTGFIISSLSDTTYRIIHSIDNTYGYEILIDEKVIIRQLNIPGMPGLNGFKRKEDAEKMAKLVLNKLAKGIMPPTIEKNEMDKLKIRYKSS